MNITKNSRNLTIALAAVIVMLVFSTISFAADSLKVELLAGQTIPVGYVEVTNSDTQITVAYVITEGGWYLVETHLHIADSITGIPINRKGNPVVGLFDYSHSYTYADKVTYDKFIVDIPYSEDDCFVIAAHASVVKMTEYGEIIQSETAWADGTRFTDQGNWGTYFEYCLTTIQEKFCETAFAYGEDYATCFLQIDLNNDGNGDFNRWGWTNQIGEGIYFFPIYAGAGQCDTTKGTLVGILEVIYLNGSATVIYEMAPGYFMDETQLYVGSEILPKDTNGNYTVAPGQYGNIHDLTDATSDSYTIEGLSDNIYVVAHAVVCWNE